MRSVPVHVLLPWDLNAGKFIEDFSQSWSWILDLGVAVVVVAALSRES